MIESFSFTHNGGLEDYLDKVFVSYGKYTFASIVNGMNNLESCLRVSRAIHEVFQNNVDDNDFDDISYEIRRNVRNSDEYVLIRLNDDELITEYHGDVKGFIIRDGEIFSITNGLMKLNDEDRLIFGTERFFSNLSSEMILIDSLTSYGAQEWMEYLICRKSEFNMLVGDNISAITMIIRQNEDVKLA